MNSNFVWDPETQMYAPRSDPWSHIDTHAAEPSPGTAVVRAEVLPSSPELDIRATPRATDQERDRAAEQVHQARADGRIDDQVHTARVAHIMAAATLQEANAVLADIPWQGMSPGERERWNKHDADAKIAEQNKLLEKMQATCGFTGLLQLLVAAVAGGIGGQLIIDHRYAAGGLMFLLCALAIVSMVACLKQGFKDLPK